MMMIKHQLSPAGPRKCSRGGILLEQIQNVVIAWFVVIAGLIELLMP